MTRVLGDRHGSGGVAAAVTVAAFAGASLQLFKRRNTRFNRRMCRE